MIDGPRAAARDTQAKDLFELIYQHQQVCIRANLGLLHGFDQAETAPAQGGCQNDSPLRTIHVPLPECPGVSNACASAPIGSAPGRMIATHQLDPALAIKPLVSPGSIPALAKDDFPLPEVPTIATNRLSPSKRNSSSLWPSRPKKRWVSFGSNGRNPGNGLAICR